MNARLRPNTSPKSSRARQAPRRSAQAARSTPPAPTAPAAAIDLDRYVPAYFTWIANKLSRGASQHYLAAFDVGIESWRVLVMLAIEGSVSAQTVSRVIGMDKASVSRCFKSMQARGLVTIGLDASDGRLRIATLTPKGRAIHDQIRGIALERERALLAVLSPAERDSLIELLHRLHENLPAVEAATDRYVAQHIVRAPRRTRAHKINTKSEDPTE